MEEQKKTPPHNELIAKAIIEVDANVVGLGAGFTVEDVAEESGVDRETVQTYMDRLVKDGVLSRGTLQSEEEYQLTDKAKRWRRNLGL